MIGITEKAIAYRDTIFNIEAEKVRKESPDIAEDILDDVGYYKYVECSYLWEFCLIRVFGIFEGIIEKKHLPKAKYTSYRNRIDKLIKKGYKYEDNDLQDWLDLRNAIVHSPPEQFRPVSLIKDDLVQLTNLLKGKLRSLDKQEPMKETI